MAKTSRYFSCWLATITIICTLRLRCATKVCLDLSPWSISIRGSLSRSRKELANGVLTLHDFFERDRITSIFVQNMLVFANFLNQFPNRKCSYVISQLKKVDYFFIIHSSRSKIAHNRYLIFVFNNLITFTNSVVTFRSVLMS